MWIRFIGLDIKYWGQAALTKLAGLVGKPLKADRATTQKERLTFARVLVEVKPHQSYPNTIMFEDEKGRIVEQEVFYEWKPTLCEKCKNFGHEMNECRRFIKEEKEKQASKKTGNEPNIENQQQKEKQEGKEQCKNVQVAQQEQGQIARSNKGNEGSTKTNDVATTSRSWQNIVRGKIRERKQQGDIRTGNPFATLGEQQQENTDENSRKGEVIITEKRKGSEMALGKGQDGGNPSSNG
ncbi:PREDICTED: uncharacterized protein LOC109233561 [Nicotiana attenuata]|uniref:uncharacterized protein LOC109233561 n=1 Tax=Nicotiana attenuata TaxID=49451 RepID=UPI000905716F|nr:PREDICTED: uncharacterized protein LOC109233561 [Nicotiana attenuata]